MAGSPPRFGGSPASASGWQGPSFAAASAAAGGELPAGSTLPIPFWVVDAFTEQAFTGNPAAVVLLPGGGEFPDGLWLSQVAREFAVSNTAFLSRRAAGDGFALRWLTPSGAEVALCGHATLAAAHALWSSGAAPRESLLRFHTRAGLVHCAAQPPPGEPPGIALDLPAAEANELPPGAPAAVLQALGPGAPLPIWVGRAPELNDMLIVLEKPEAVRDLAPDLQALAAFGGRGVIVTSAARDAGWAGGADYVARWFAPAVGIPEDAVTGSAHCALGPFWAERLRKAELRALQCSPRGGRIALRVDRAAGRVLLLGDCITVFRGEIDALPGTMVA